MLLILTKFKRSSQVPFPLKSSENLWFSGDSGGVEVS